MSEGIDRLKASLGEKMTHLQARLDNAKARFHEQGVATHAAVQEQLAKARAARDAQMSKFEAAKQRLHDSFEAKKAETEQKIAEWKAARELKKLTKRADRAEERAADAILMAAIALDDADYATLEAIEARIIAEEATGA